MSDAASTTLPSGSSSSGKISSASGLCSSDGHTVTPLRPGRWNARRLLRFTAKGNGRLLRREHCGSHFTIARVKKRGDRFQRDDKLTNGINGTHHELGDDALAIG